MKKIFTTLLVSTLTLTMMAQPTDYNFSQRTSAYQELTNKTIFSNSIWKPDDVYQIDVPFHFTMFNKYFVADSLEIRQNMVMQVNDMGYWGGMAPFYMTLEEHPMGSELSYETTGTIPNRIFKIQIKNAGFADDITAGQQNYVNFQVWLFEDDHSIEYHYGPSLITDSAIVYNNKTGPAIGFRMSSAIGGNTLNGQVDTPKYEQGFFSRVTGTPKNGQVYRFGPQFPVSIISLSTLNFKAYPNPFQDKLTLSSGDQKSFSYSLTDLLGKTVIQETSALSTVTLNTSLFKPGVYFATLRTSEGTIRRKLLRYK